MRDARPSAGQVLGADAPAVRLGDDADDREAEPGALPVAVARRPDPRTNGSNARESTSAENPTA